MPTKKDNGEKAVVSNDVAPNYTQAAPSSMSVADVQKANRKYWEQKGGDFFPNHHYRETK